MSFYKNIHVDIPHAYMRFVVGKNGSHLKHCRKMSGVDSVWFNMKRNVVEIYGNRDNLCKADSYITKRIDHVKTHKIPCEEKDVFVPPPKEDDIFVEGQLEGALTKDQIKHLIGKKGAHFKKITRDAEISFIWYNANTHSIQIYGPKNKLDNAVKMLYEHIHTVRNKLHSESKEDTEMTDDVSSSS